jgi:TRAP-type C4-dicarboxylate transport system substrate-binding protein
VSGVGYVFQTRFRPSDLSAFKGKKVRSIPLYDPILETLGAIPVTTSPAEAYTAIERGVVDGLGWPNLGLLDFKFYEHAKYIVSPTYYQLRSRHLLNPNSFKKLPKELQDVLVKASRSADKIGEAWCKKTRDEEHAKMASHGVEIVKLPPADAKRFINLTEVKLWAKILQQSPANGARLKALFDKAAGQGLGDALGVAAGSIGVRRRRCRLAGRRSCMR